MSGKCEAHTDLMESVRVIRESQSQLYDLDRSRALQITEIKETIARHGVKIDNISANINDFMAEIEAQQKTFGDFLDKIYNKMDASQKMHWTPTAKAAVIAPIVTSISAIIIALAT
jgi:hypothetical protein